MIYIHVPFCRTFCTYCGFYSEIPCRSGKMSADGDFLRYSADLSREIAARAGEFSSETDTLYIGGGTPSVLPLSVLSDLLHALEKAGKTLDFKEFTIEVNPDDIVSGGLAYVRGLLELGVTRISMGVQSFDDGLLRWMNRRHDAAEAEKAYSLLREGGADNVSLDLIFGISSLDMGLWDRTLDRILSLPEGLPDHISAYQLSIEPGSALDRLSEQGKYQDAPEERCALQYAALCSRLSEAGYHHYEISNFALPGREAVHNSAYWTGVPYTGLGPGAHSYSLVEGKSVRSWNNPSLKEYHAAAETGDFAAAGGSEVLTPEQIVEERIMLGLRTDRGIPEEELKAMGKEAKAAEMLREGELERTPDGRSLRIPEKHLFISDSIIVGLL